MTKSIRFLTTDEELVAFIAIVAATECDCNESHAIRMLLREARQHRLGAEMKEVDNESKV